MTSFVAQNFNIHSDPRTIGSDGELFSRNPMFGIEVELEGYVGQSWDMKYWQAVADGSLRDGMEYILKVPMGGVDLEKALVEFDETIATGNFSVTKRCSTHIHVDMREADIKQISMFCFLYAVYERLIIKSLSPNRESNFYCLPFYKSARNSYALSRFTAGGLDLGNKYSSLNWRPLERFGSVELRVFNAATSADDLRKILMVVRDIYEYSLQIKDMEYSEVLQQFSANAETHLFEDVFRTSAQFLEYSENDLIKSMRAAQTIAVLSQVTDVRPCRNRCWSPRSGALVFLTSKDASTAKTVREAWERVEDSSGKVVPLSKKQQPLT